MKCRRLFWEGCEHTKHCSTSEYFLLFSFFKKESGGSFYCILGSSNHLCRSELVTN